MLCMPRKRSLQAAFISNLCCLTPTLYPAAHLHLVVLA